MGLSGEFGYMKAYFRRGLLFGENFAFQNELDVTIKTAKKT